MNLSKYALYQADIGLENFETKIYYGISEIKFLKKIFELYKIFQTRQAQKWHATIELTLEN